MTIRRNKFGAKRTELDGIMFDSKAEASRYATLKIIQKAGEISDLKCQPGYTLSAYDEFGNVFDIGVYKADFEYTDANGSLVVEDVKGGKATLTPLSRWKIKHFQAQYGLTVSLIDGKGRAI